MQTKQRPLWAHRKMLSQIDGRTALAKQFKRLKEDMIQSIGGNPSPQELVLLDRAVFLIWRVTTFEKRILSGESFGDATHTYYLAYVNSLRRLMETLGIKRQDENVITLEALLKNGTD